MKQCKALFKKEIQTHWSILLTPVWFTGGVYVTTLIGLIIGWLKGSSLDWAVSVKHIPKGMEGLIMYSSVYSISLLLGVVATITAIILADSLINGGFKRKCEILHLSQPVTLSRILGIKYLLMVPGTFLIFSLMALINAFVMSCLQIWFLSGHFYFGFVAWVQSILETGFSMMFLSSLFWFFAALYRQKSFFKGVLTILGIQAVISILNYTAGLDIPSLLGYIGRLATIRFELNGSSNPQALESVFYLITQKWLMLWSWETLLKVVYSIALFVGGFHLYRRRQVS